MRSTRVLVGTATLVATSVLATGGVAFAAGGERTAAAGASTDLTVHTADGRDRTAHLYVPATLPADRPVPLLVAMHGGVGSGTQFEATTGFDHLADEHGFVVVYPDGIGIGPAGDKLRTWNAGVCCGPAAKNNVDDVAFLRDLVTTISKSQHIDRDRVFATGHSNGMIMAYRLLCDASDVFVAAAGQSGTLGVDDCHPAQPVSLRHIHGTADTNLPIDGGRGSNGISNVDFPSPRVGIRTFAHADGCPAASTTKTHGPATTRTWKPCGGHTTVEFVTVDGASHAWMGAAGRTRPGGPVPFAGYDSSTSVWEFLAAHPRGT
jgi:polyhydroxybutyrate depolymerase